MYSLLSTYFQGVKLDVFNADLNSKNWVILLKNKKTEKLQGFSTLLIYDSNFNGENFSVVYSGDTIVEPNAWSSSSLSRTWIKSVNQLRLEYTQNNIKNKLYWLLISSGYRTYRFLPTFWQEFYPRYDVKTPSNISELMMFLASQRFGNYYDPMAGVVRFPHPHQLENRLKGIPKERLEDPHINFFQQQNPGHMEGDELVCLTEISEQNLTLSGERMWFG